MAHHRRIRQIRGSLKMEEALILKWVLNRVGLTFIIISIA